MICFHFYSFFNPLKFQADFGTETNVAVYSKVRTAGLVISPRFGIGEVVCVERKRGKFPDFFRHTQVQHEIRIKGIFHEISGLPAFDHVLEYRVVCFCFSERVNSTVLIHVCYRINILVIGFVFF